MNNPVNDKLMQSIHQMVTPLPGKQRLDFVKDYYRRISAQDYREDRVPFFLQAALRHLDLARDRKPGQTLIRIDNLMSLDSGVRTLVSIVTDDHPFLINSLTVTLNHLGYRIERTNHPLFQVQRNPKHRIHSIERYRSGEFSRSRSDRTILETFIQFDVDPVEESAHPVLVDALNKTVANIEVVTGDWSYMRDATLSLADRVEQSLQGPAFAEYGALFRWMAEDHFAFIGYCELETSGQRGNYRVNEDSLTGILRAAHLSGNDVMEILPPIMLSKTSPVIFTKSRQRLFIHRANYLDCILVDHGFGQPAGSRKRRVISCILGFLAGSTATMAVAMIPHLRSKAAFILSESSLRKGSFAYKELRTILETLPREMLFQMETRALYGLCMTLLNQQERHRTRLHLHRNVCQHYFTCLVYVPRDLFHTRLRQRILEYLEERLHAREITFNVYFSESILVRVQYTVHCDADFEPDITQQELEQDVQTMARDWNENLFVTAQEYHTLDEARALLNRWRDGFPASYQENFDLETALTDIACLPAESPEAGPTINQKLLVSEDVPSTAHFKIYSSGNTIPLSDALPILESMGIRILGEHPYRIRNADGAVFWIQDFEIVHKDGLPFAGSATGLFEATFAAVWHGQAENDGFNQLVLATGFDWRLVSAFRAYFRYLRQIKLRYSENYIIEALMHNTDLVREIGDLFFILFEPERKQRPFKSISKRIVEKLDAVQTLDEERIIRALLDVIRATLRTSYFQTPGGTHRPYIAFKLDSRSIPRIPEPAPMFEIFLYSPRVEGVHLRGGEVARGGLRWSERPEDFRTEVLGLVKAQRVKNAVIVPVGSKGGFVAKQLPAAGDREQVQAEVIASYRDFISGLLDLTDNLVDGAIVPPENVIRRDRDDPYLVVAADKGTATFSDIANSIAIDHGFWLGDAFASGGSDGYDHKKMGITARGAWESVKRNFRELGKDIQNEEFTVVGIGDMSGDVFGNGMLLSPHIRLVAAFNHLHIFIDPEPDAARSYKERMRLFGLPRSSWADYNEKLISAGGGIYPRTAKSIKLSPQAKKALSAERDSYTPNELIHAILKAEVDLLWNGGIGTYVKASTETHQDAQDRSNDSLRANADELRVRVVGEGGNLGMTQEARIEYNQNGGLCYTDAIDNSAGVDTSDHEVNIKILLNAAVQAGTLTPRTRKSLLARMESEVGSLVLNNNYIQTQTLSVESSYGGEVIAQQARLIQLLENKELLNRALEFLPDNEELRLRQEAGQGLTRAELAVVLSYGKMDLYQSLLLSDVPDDPYLYREIEAYFPRVLLKKYRAQMETHRLRREIIATQLTNDMVGKLGAGFHLRVSELTGASVPDVTRAFVVSRDVFRLDQRQQWIQDMDNRVATDLQYRLLRDIAYNSEAAIVWLLRNRPGCADLGSIVLEFRAGLDKLETALASPGDYSAPAYGEDLRTAITAGGLDRKATHALLSIPAESRALDIIDIANTTGQPMPLVSEVYLHCMQQLHLQWVREAVDGLPASSDWNQRARFSLAENLRTSHTRVVREILGASKDKSASARIDAWARKREQPLHHVSDMLHRLQQESRVDFAMLSVLVSELSNL